MGDLNKHILSDFGCNILIETGTGQGTGTSYACMYPFEQIHTIEIMPELRDFSKSRITDERVTFHLGNSVEVLDQILPTFKPTDRILFWVDAHFPGVDFGLGLGYGNYVFDDENMPLDRELTVITKHRKNCQDSLIIDDLRFYEEGNFQTGNIDIGKPKVGIGFIKNYFIETHDFSKDFRDQGFLIITPKIKAI